MPIREFRCKECDIKFEEYYKTRDEFDKWKDFTPCPECSLIAEPLIAITGRPQFYGSGFYETDYKRK